MWTVVKITTNRAGEVVTSRPMIEPTTKERAERFAVRCTMAEDFNGDAHQSYQAVPVKE